MNLSLRASLLSFCLFAACNIQAAILTYSLNLNGLNESPPNLSPGTGFGSVVIDDVLKTMSVNVSFADLLGPTTAAHIHAATADPFTGTAGVATTLDGFPLGTSGIYSNIFDMTLTSSYSGAFLTSNGGSADTALIALTSAANSGRAYLNIHTTVFPGGEIRGFLVSVPEPSPVTLLLAGIAGLTLIRKRTLSPVLLATRQRTAATKLITKIEDRIRPFTVHYQ